MFSALLLVATVQALGDDGTLSTPKHELEAYQAAEAKAGKTAPEQVRLALWCEQRGLTAERLKHLALAVTYKIGRAHV